MKAPIVMCWILSVALAPLTFGEALIELVPVGGAGNEITVLSDTTVTVEVYISNVAPTLLQGYQASVEPVASGGLFGTVEHDGVDPVIDTTRPDFVFAGKNPLTTTGVGPPPTVLALVFNAADSVLITDPAYGGEFTYVVSPDAVGDFTIELTGLDVDLTSLIDDNSQPIPFSIINATVHVLCQTNEDCSDGLFCNGEEICNLNGVCEPGTPPCPQPGLPFCNEILDSCVECLFDTDCDDLNECTVDDCNPGTGLCENPPEVSGTPCGDSSDTQCTNPDTCDGAGTCLDNHEPNGTPCDDELFCNENEACQAGVCTGGSFTCDDGIPCTTDTCDEELDLCSNDLDAGYCLILGTCYTEGATNPANECERCFTSESTSDWSLKPDGTPCTDDTNDCTDDVCQVGVCQHPFHPPGTSCGSSADTDCDNPDTCDGAGTCLENHEPDLLACTDDGNECTDDYCQTGACTHPNHPAGTPCGSPDDTQCTDPDTCSGAGVCLGNHAPTGTTCDDGLYCNVGEICLSGLCANGSARNCSDSIPCTTDSCNEDLDTCENVLQADYCLIEQSCYAQGQLNPTNECEDCNVALATETWSHRPDATGCTDDGNDCTDDHCNTGVCIHPDWPEGTACGDQSDSDCDHPDTCDGTGTCLINWEPDLFRCTDDGNDCTDDHCIAGACTHPDWPAGTPCGDSSDSQCDHPDTCDGTGDCLINHEPDGTFCDDFNDCTGPDTCQSGLCDTPFPAPLAQTAGARRFDVTPQAPGDPTVLQALLVTSPDHTCLSKYVDASGQLSETPVFLSPTDWGTITVTGSDLVPESTYHVATECGGDLTVATPVDTGVWGDVTNNGITNILDALCVLEVLAGDPADCTTIDADISPCPPNGVVNILDVFQVLFEIETPGSFPCAGPCGGGACCIGQDCEITTDAMCPILGGVFQGDGVHCDPNPCP